MTQNNAEQQRAKYAFKKIKPIAEKLNLENEDKNRKEWLSRSNELPAMVQMNGLGQTIAFYRSKAAQGSNAHKQLINILQGWLIDEVKLYQNNDIMEAITQGDMHQYRAAQAETQAFLIWIKKIQ